MESVKGAMEMNVDEAMAYAKQLSGGSLNFSHHSNLRTLAIGALYNEVERLREENEWMGIAGQQMARHLAEAKAELAAAKAASVVQSELEKQNHNYLVAIAAICQTHGGQIHFTDKARHEIGRDCHIETWRDLASSSTMIRVQKERDNPPPAT